MNRTAPRTGKLTYLDLDEAERRRREAIDMPEFPSLMNPWTWRAIAVLCLVMYAICEKYPLGFAG